MASLKNKFNRLATNNSQLQQFGDEVCTALDDGEGGMTKPISEEGVESLIEADKDIISQIKVEYNEDENVSKLILPIGILPLCFITNERAMFFKDYKVVDALGRPFQDLTTKRFIFHENESYITFNGNLSNETFLEMIYVLYNKKDNSDRGTITENSYYLFNPITETGTKLYKHEMQLKLKQGATTTTNFKEIKMSFTSTDSTVYSTYEDFSYVLGLSYVYILNIKWSYCLSTSGEQYYLLNCFRSNDFVLMKISDGSIIHLVDSS